MREKIKAFLHYMQYNTNTTQPLFDFEVRICTVLFSKYVVCLHGKNRHMLQNSLRHFESNQMMNNYGRYPFIMYFYGFPIFRHVHYCGYKKRLKIPMGKLEAVNRRTFNTMSKKSTKYVA